MAVALTSTINLVFGSQVLDPETGIILNDEATGFPSFIYHLKLLMCLQMADFSIPGVPDPFGLRASPCLLRHFLRFSAPYTNFAIDNFPEPGKRPLSSMTPTIMEYEDGSFYLAIGGVGGSRIFPSVFQVILNLDWGLDASQAVEFARVHHQLLPDHVKAEAGYPLELLLGLTTRGHKVIGEFSPLTLSILRSFDSRNPAGQADSSVEVVLRENGKFFGRVLSVPSSIVVC
jgi:gamma-glutamyltranspeptidase/glutathione hydrolase/leukotriene-C4 hydrolase